ncbi:MAG: RusA family crossover junction endodeoxyribonuclease [Synergistaceae bacterium]|nr:RusA family crossover junction endodeoxyribonuclease [Synergistaceae bacterium]
MSTLISIWLDGLPPSVNHLYKYGNKRAYISAEARTWQKYAAAAMKLNYNKNAVPSQAPVKVKIRFITPNNRRWDIDNRLKSLLDCLAKAGIILDDCQIHRLDMRRENVKGAASQTFIEVREL